MCRHEQLAADRAKRHWATLADTDLNMFNLTPFHRDKQGFCIQGPPEQKSKHKAIKRTLMKDISNNALKCQRWQTFKLTLGCIFALFQSLSDPLIKISFRRRPAQ